MKRRKMLCSLNLIAVVAISISFIFIAPAWAENPDLHVKVMTRNMYLGTDFSSLALATNESELQSAISATILNVLQNRIPERAALVASEIAQTKPDLIALQEVTLWTIETEDGTLVIDQLDLLLDSLDAAGMHYKKAVDQELTFLEVPGAASYTDRDVILMRADLPPGHLKILGSEKHLYDVLMPFPVLGNVLESKRGWIAVDVKIQGARFKFVNTHLEAPIFDIAMTQAIQFAQAMQLVGDLEATQLPTILAGDLNSDAEDTENYFPDETPSYHYIVGAGYVDAWHELHPADHGFTWPLFGSNPIEGVDPIERIDLIFSKGPEAISIISTGLNPADGLFASDHAGMVAVFSLENHRPDAPGIFRSHGRQSNARPGGRR